MASRTPAVVVNGALYELYEPHWSAIMPLTPPQTTIRIAWTRLLTQMRMHALPTLTLEELELSYFPLIRTRWASGVHVGIDYEHEEFTITFLKSAYHTTPLARMRDGPGADEPGGSGGLKADAVWLIWWITMNACYVDLDLYRDRGGRLEVFYGSRPPDSLVAAGQWLTEHTQEAVDEAVRQGWITNKDSWDP